MTWTAQYDTLYANAGAKYFSEIDWRWLKAQGIAESGLDPTAVSSTGAAGIAQFEPETWADTCSEMGVEGNAHEPVYAIPAQAYYLHDLWESWQRKREPIDRLRLAFASYNAGLGNLLRAQKRAGNATDYDTIIVQLHNITGNANSSQTMNYVTRIQAYYAQLVGAHA
jgi:membrane-bound lytic murein transglycosylase F